jgi:diguanylate cyclase (GGDEF)-like protein/PAS domain S-box-containing protein
MLGAACALYNRLDSKGMLCSVGRWHTPEDYNPKDRPEGHICYDIITQGKGRYLLIRDLQHTAYAKTDPNVKRYKLRTYLGYPIRWNGETVGSLCAVYRKDFVPSEEDLKLFGIIAAAVEVEESRGRAEESLRESEERFRIIFESTTDCVLVWDKDYNYLYANQAAIDHVGTTRNKVIGKNIRSGFGHIPEFMKLWMARIDKVFQTQKPMKVEDVNMVGNKLVYSESVVSPMRDKNGDVFAVGVVYRDITSRKRAEEELKKVNKELISSNRRLNQLALRDTHTGLYNHRYLAEIIVAEFYRAKKYNTPLSVIMVDVDYFKSINETYGHQFGDLVLKQLSQQLRKAIRQYDIIIRYGGEEFIVISPGIDIDQALTLAQRIFDTVSIYNFGNDKNAVKLKITLAAASYPEDKVASAMDMIKVAEQMLARAKEEGGNRVYSSMDKRKIASVLARSAKGKGLAVLKDKLDKLHKEVNQSLVESIFAFAKTIELKDHYTGEHVEKTVKYATDIAKALGLSKAEIEYQR